MTDLAAIAAFLDTALAREFGAQVRLVPIPNPPVAHCATLPTPPSAITPSGGDFLEDNHER